MIAKGKALQSIFEVTFDIARRLEREAEEEAEAARARQVREAVERQEKLALFREIIRAQGLATQGLQFQFVTPVGGKTMPAIVYSHMNGMSYIGKRHRGDWVVVEDNGFIYEETKSFSRLMEALEHCVCRWGEFEAMPSDDQFQEAEDVQDSTGTSMAEYLGVPRWMVAEWRAKKAA